MKYLKFKQKIFERLLLILLLLPPISFLFYAFTGVFFNFNTLNFIIYILLICLLLSSIRWVSRSSVNYLLVFLGVLIVNLAGHVMNQGGDGLVDFLKTISGYYMFVIMGILIYQLYYKQDQTERLLKMVVRFGIFISVVNLFHYIYIATDDYVHSNWSIEFDNYQLMADYLNELNKSFFDYILIGLNYDNALRPVGFFYDTHAQYYFPLASCIIMLFNPKIVRYSKVLILFMVSTIILSSIKTAILSIFILVFIWMLLNSNVKKLMIYVIPALLLVAFVFRNLLLTMLLGENMLKIMVQLFNHLVYVPMMFFLNNIVGFLIGGTSFLRDDPNYYSEVFWVTVTFYIGITGLIVYLQPLRLLKGIKNPKWTMAAYLFLSMALSMAHYGVYAVGVNNLVSALPVMYCLAYMNDNYNKEKEKKYD